MLCTANPAVICRSIKHSQWRLRSAGQAHLVLCFSSLLPIYALCVWLQSPADVSNAANGGQVLLDEPTFAAVKEGMRRLGLITADGLDYDKLYASSKHSSKHSSKRGSKHAGGGSSRRALSSSGGSGSGAVTPRFLSRILSSSRG
jgi:hypothetical protein